MLTCSSLGPSRDRDGGPTVDDGGPTPTVNTLKTNKSDDSRRNKVNDVHVVCSRRLRTSGDYFNPVYVFSLCQPQEFTSTFLLGVYQHTALPAAEDRGMGSQSYIKKQTRRDPLRPRGGGKERCAKIVPLTNAEQTHV